MSAIDIQREILTNALRLSCEDKDAAGVLKSAQQLHQLFPDLLPDQSLKYECIDCYKVLNVINDAPKSVVIANYFRAVKKFLRAKKVKEHRREYFSLLDAGTILCNKRLRLSHDLVVARDWLVEHAECFSVTPINVGPLPDLVAVLKLTAVINDLEVQALLNQMQMAPAECVEDLLLSAGYLTAKQLEWLKAKLSSYNMQRCSASQWTEQPDWPFGGGPIQGPGQSPNDLGPFDPSRVPRNPLPTSGAGSIELPLPKSHDDNDC
ncbi:MAG: hypothetical protein JST89_14700 [Cyanobacteria bacterium SZAS-4]|nr:hypothetical protein [Cyanobacteria bacterium SZAS-4]